MGSLGSGGEYAAEVGLYWGLVGEYVGDVGEYAGDVGEYCGDVGLFDGPPQQSGPGRITRATSEVCFTNVSSCGHLTKQVLWYFFGW